MDTPINAQQQATSHDTVSVALSATSSLTRLLTYIPVRVPVSIGSITTIDIAYSEAACFMGVAGTPMGVEVIPTAHGGHCAQLYAINDDGTYRPVSFPIGLGEAGIFTDTDGSHYGYRHYGTR